MPIRRHAYAPGRVNLIGDHTDYTGGLVLPMAIDLGTNFEFEAGNPWVELISTDEADPAVIDLDIEYPSAIQPSWAKYVAGVVAVMRPSVGGTGLIRSTLPMGAGLASSAALQVAAAMAIGFSGDRVALARLCQRAEEAASGVRCGIMDQLASVMGVAGHALLIDCGTLEVDPIAIPDGVEVLAVHSGQQRSLATSAYGVRRAQCEEAEAIVGSLRSASLDDLAAIEDPLLRQRARHVVTENARVGAFAAALRNEDLATAGDLMVESHASLREDFEVSTTGLDELVARLTATPGVFGARLTGAGFGGCVVALGEEGVEVDADLDAWLVRPAAGSTVEEYA